MNIVCAMGNDNCITNNNYYSTGTPHMRRPFFYGCSSYLWEGGDDQLLTTADDSVWG